ncbi:MAG TPA: LCP family protein [Candidatus Saccharimonadales bacterium]|nr:LCP family protein [Candidatus Saccharimonadales bacterium]
MKKPKRQKQPPIQTGKNLPQQGTVYSYSPSHPQPERAGQPLPVVEPKRRSVWKRALLSLILIIFIAVIVLGTWDARNISAASKKLFGSGNVLSLIKGGTLKGSSDGRVNVLLVGYSVDDPGHPGALLTDSIILLSMSTTSKTGYMLSIPRDLYVQIPGFGYAKINEAYTDGGMKLLEQVITTDFQQPIDYYGIVNYAAVKDTVNALGGITVDIKSPDPRGLYDPNISKHDGGPLKLPNGVQTLDGQTALNLTRARGDAYNSYGFPQSDFDRTEHQRQVLTAIKNKLSWKLVLNPHKNSQILDAIADNVKTDVSVSDARPLFGLFNSIPSAKLKSLSLRDLDGHNYLASYFTPTGEDALIPTAGIGDYSQIVAALNKFDQ